MGWVIAVVLLLFAVGLFVAASTNKIPDKTLQTGANVAGIVALFAAIAVFLLPAPDSTGGAVDTNTGATGDSRLPAAPPDIAGPILDERDLFSIGFGADTGCYAEGNDYTVIVSKAGQDDIWASEAPFFFLIDGRGVEEKYYLSSTLSQAVRSWIPVILVPGRHLKIQYALCGNQGLKFLTYIEPLSANSS
ncbi:MAG: hypothetical protein HC837_06430 [Chloroflexaceae bacterium]|nr:hypothetical protein [Chloroflexaceae bacterium]